MPVTLPIEQLLIGLVAASFFLLLSFSRTKPIDEAVGLIFGAHYLVINTILWIYFLATSTWEGQQIIFSYGGPPLLPGISFYGGIVSVFVIVSSWILMMSGENRYSHRQILAFSFATLIVLTGIVISLTTPIRVQSFLNSL